MAGWEEKVTDGKKHHPKDDWNYGIPEKVIQSPAQYLQVNNIKPVTADFVWNLEHAPLTITTTGKKNPEWKLVDDVAPQPVTDRNGVYKGKVSDKEEIITLVPYGCTKVRIVAFPVVK